MTPIADTGFGRHSVRRQREPRPRTGRAWYLQFGSGSDRDGSELPDLRQHRALLPSWRRIEAVGADVDRCNNCYPGRRTKRHFRAPSDARRRPHLRTRDRPCCRGRLGYASSRESNGVYNDLGDRNWDDFVSNTLGGTHSRWDFVIGLLFGIILACIFFVVQSSRRKAIRAVFSGSTAKSTVRRPRAQRAFLQQVGSQTCVMKLQGFRESGRLKCFDCSLFRHNHYCRR